MAIATTIIIPILAVDVKPPDGHVVLSRVIPWLGCAGRRAGLPVE
jgi:hypothetical protein